MNVNEIPLPADDVGVLQTAVFLAEQKKSTLDALSRLGLAIAADPMQLMDAPMAEIPTNMKVHVDCSVPAAFLAALDDGEVTMDEAREIAHMPANRELLRFIREHFNDAEPQLNQQTLRFLIWKAGSTDPLDRLWSWLNPMNDFGYADLAANTTQYRQLIDDLEARQQDVADTALARVAPFFPPGTQIDETFVFTPSCLISDWATPALSGANVFHIKGGLEGSVRRISAGLYLRQLLKGLSGPNGDSPQTVDDVVRAGLSDERYELFHELIASTVLQGAASYVGNPVAPIDEMAGIIEGANLIDDFVAVVIGESHMESARTILEKGRAPGGPLCALGRHMARGVAERDGSQAVTALLDQGVINFFQRAVEIELDDGGRLFDDEVVSAVRDLSARLDR